MMLFIKQQYTRSARELAVAPDLVVRAPHREERVVVPIPGLNRAVVQAINVGRSISDDVRAVYITDDPEDGGAGCATDFERQIPGVAAGRRRVAVPGARRAAARLPRRPRLGLAAGQARRRSRSWSSPSTWPAAGGSGSSTTSPPSGCGRSCSAVRTRSSSTSRTGARTRRCSRRLRGGERTERAGPPSPPGRRRAHLARRCRVAAVIGRTAALTACADRPVVPVVS